MVLLQCTHIVLLHSHIAHIAYSNTALTEFCIVLFNIVLSDSAHDDKSDIALCNVILHLTWCS